ncbi:MAG: DHH family phosphoesterase [Candidatus Brocadiia bacterium]
MVVTSHQNLDGDGAGAALALWNGLNKSAIKCLTYFKPPIPKALQSLPGLGEHVENITELPSRFHLVVLDCGSIDRIGELSREKTRFVKIINIDHHRTNDFFGHQNLVEQTVSSTAELVYRILKTGDVCFEESIARCLYAAILTDTGSFTFSNTTPQAFEIAAELVHLGVEPWRLADKLYFSPPEEVVRLKGLAISTLRLEKNGRVATMKITEDMFRQTGACPVDTQGFADIPISVRNVEVSALLKEIKGNPKPPCIKISLRSRAARQPVDVCAVAESFGGGGHRHAAGCEMEVDIDEARKIIVETLSQELEP